MDRRALAMVLAPAAGAVLWTASCATPPPSPGRSSAEEAAYAAMIHDLERLASREEAYYMQHYTYSADLGELEFTSSLGVLVILNATEDGWSARAAHSDLGEGKGCVFYYGSIPPPNNPITPPSPGEVACTDRPGPQGRAEPHEATVRVYPAGQPPEEADLAAIFDEPVFTPYTQRPDITNREDIARALEREYPPDLRAAGTGGTVRIWFLLDAEGAVRKTQIDEGSGREALDEAAMRVAGVYRFTPARNRGQAVPVWISLPITFRVR